MATALAHLSSLTSPRPFHPFTGIHPAYLKRRLGVTFLIFFATYLREATPYKYMWFEAEHPVTERLMGELGARVMSRVKLSDIEVEEEDGTKVRPLTGIPYDVCMMELVLKPRAKM